VDSNYGPYIFFLQCSNQFTRLDIQKSIKEIILQIKICGQSVIVDGLLCNRSASQPELVFVIEKKASENEVKGSWLNLFTHFDLMDPTRKKKIIDTEMTEKPPRRGL
jgi:hypothetical protein